MREGLTEMKKTTILVSLSLIFAGLVALPIAGKAESSVDGNGSIRFIEQKDGAREIKDPENMKEIVDPGESPFTEGDLRIDFVPKLNFGANKISNKDEVYSGNAQLFHGETAARGNFIQISDYRGTGTGWLLQVRQETQFQNVESKAQQLNGATISLDKSWVNSTRSQSEAPIVSKDVIRIDNIGETYNLAEAKPGTGQGTWDIIFGSSESNENNQLNTLIPRVDNEGKPILDPTFENKQVYENKALNLSIPGATKKEPVAYQTVITWILSELP